MEDETWEILKKATKAGISWILDFVIIVLLANGVLETFKLGYMFGGRTAAMIFPMVYIFTIGFAFKVVSMLIELFRN